MIGRHRCATVPDRDSDNPNNGGTMGSRSAHLGGRYARGAHTVLACSAALILLAACSSGGSAATGSSTAAATGPSGSSTSAAGQAAAAGTPGGSSGNSASTSAGSSAGTGSGSAGPVLGQATTADQDTPLSVALTEVRVLGQLLQVSFTVRNMTPAADAGIGWTVGTFFSNGTQDAVGVKANSADFSTIDGVYVLDPKNAKRYLVARDPRGVCACTGTSSTYVKGGTPVTFTGTFKAPPPDVATVTVVIPKVAPFENVPVQR
jgi:hypothetical protein